MFPSGSLRSIALAGCYLWPTDYGGAVSTGNIGARKPDGISKDGLKAVGTGLCRSSSRVKRGPHILIDDTACLPGSTPGLGTVKRRCELRQTRWRNPPIATSWTLITSEAFAGAPSVLRAGDRCGGCVHLACVHYLMGNHIGHGCYRHVLVNRPGLSRGTSKHQHHQISHSHTSKIFQLIPEIQASPLNPFSVQGVS